MSPPARVHSLPQVSPDPDSRPRGGPTGGPSRQRAPRPETLSLRFTDAPDREGPQIYLEPGQITLVEGARGTEPARHRLVIDAARSGRRAFQVVAAHRLDPTGLARRARARDLDPGLVLRSSVLARAFTAYQLSVLLEERLPAGLAADDAAVGLAVDPLRLYTDEDVHAAEARRLAEQAIDRLAEVAYGADVPLVVMQPPRTARRELTHLLREAADQRVLLRAEPDTGSTQSGQVRPAYTVHLPEEETRQIVQSPRPRQARLDRFHGSTRRGEARG